MRGTGKRHGGFAPLLENFCQSETAPRSGGGHRSRLVLQKPVEVDPASTAT
jgi:hypothetical protein